MRDTKRFLGCVLLCMYLLDTITTVLCQSRVQATVGDAVLLPCVYQKTLSKRPVVHWRDSNNVAVLDIRDNTETKKDKFGTRVRSFPEGYQQGNFSIEVRDVRPEDSDVYDCFIPALDVQQRVSLEVKNTSTSPADKPVLKGAKPAPRGASTVNSLHTMAPLLLMFITSC